MANEVWTMVSTTNERFKYLEGTTGILQYDDFYNVYWFNNFHTSSIVNKKETKTKITLQTLNSVYVFKKTGLRKIRLKNLLTIIQRLSLIKQLHKWEKFYKRIKLFNTALPKRIRDASD